MNENESTAVYTEGTEQIPLYIEDSEYTALSTESSFANGTCENGALTVAKEELSENIGVDVPVKSLQTERGSFVSALFSTVILKIIPWSLAVVSLIVPITLLSVFLSDLNISFAGLTRLMLGDMVGGAENITVIDSSSPDPGISNIPQLNEDSGSDTAEKIDTPSDPAVSPDFFVLSNETPYEPNMEEILEMPRSISSLDELYAEYGENAPIVLIIHTHATEGFSDTAEENYRTTDSTRNVIALGKIIKDRLEAAGIRTIHCTDMFDTPDFNMAYYSASQKIREYISTYPSISYVLDIHRDSIQLEDGSYYSPTVSTEFGDAAQIMFVIGTDHGGSGHTEWRDNLSLAARLQAEIGAEHPSLMRNINLRSASFNEQYTKGSLLIEIGACASNSDEAKLSAKILADHLAREIIG